MKPILLTYHIEAKGIKIEVLWNPVEKESVEKKFNITVEEVGKKLFATENESETTEYIKNALGKDLKLEEYEISKKGNFTTKKVITLSQFTDVVAFYSFKKNSAIAQMLQIVFSYYGLYTLASNTVGECLTPEQNQELASNTIKNKLERQFKL
jgi:uncharacterized membrane protein